MTLQKEASSAANTVAAREAQFYKTGFDGIGPLLRQYAESLSGGTDDFWEAHILGAAPYVIRIGGRTAGFFTLWEKKKLTSFYLGADFLPLAQPVFRRILAEYGVRTAFAATCDEALLSLCLDFHSRIEPQAYFFDGTVPHAVRPPEYSRECIHPVAPQELPAVKGLTGDFFDFLSERDLTDGRAALYRLEERGELLGFGIIVPNRLAARYHACGMITLANRRRKGAGRSIQIHLGDICRENGAVPVSGCWYQNLPSKKTIESAGRYSKTRLLNIFFPTDKE
jgi:hypothetical protein